MSPSSTRLPPPADRKQDAATNQTVTEGPGPHHVFAPRPDPAESILHRIYIIFEESDRRLWASGTGMMAPNLESAEAFSDRLNETLVLDSAARSALVTRVFAASSKSSPPDNR